MCISMPARVIEVDGRGREATVDVDGAVRSISLAVLTLEGTVVAPGDWLLVHTGLAVTRLDPDEAAELVTLHRELHRQQEAP
jgi:hydrogenase expression/formation protein HypC